MLLPYEYWPSLQWMQLFYNSPEVVMQEHGNYQKQSLFNRCHVAGRNGPLTLSVPLRGGREQKIPVDAVLIDATQRWAVRHCRTLRSCYGKAPYFDYYYPPIEFLLCQEHETLIGLNRRILQQLVRWLKWKGQMVPSQTYEPATAPAAMNQKPLVPYVQVFAGSVPFVPNLSILDALMCLGPRVEDYLTASVAGC